VSQFPDGGDISFDRDDWPLVVDSALNYRLFRNVLMHEIGHAFGLDHVVSSDAAFLMEPAVNVSFDGPQIDDIRGLHHLYGDRFEKANQGAGNNSAMTATELGLLPSGTVISLGGDGGYNTIVAPTDTDFLSISGALNPDFYAFEIVEPAYLDVVIAPQGGSFHQQVAGGGELLNDAFASSDLAFSILASDGATLADVNQLPSGGVEMTHNVFLPSAGKYLIEVTGSREVAQLYALRLSLMRTNVPEPRTMRVAAFVAATFCCAFRHRCSTHLWAVSR
jgi:hypothetical protein